MLEVLFSDSAAGSLQCAMGHGSQIGGCLGIIATDESGRLLAPEETARLQREAEERMRRNWAEAIPMEGSPQDILSFPLSLPLPGCITLLRFLLTPLKCVYFSEH